jgi:predicted HicB family RNase H-like nuclease
MGKMAKPKPEAGSVRFTVQVSADVRAAMQAAADADERSLRNWTERAIADYLRQKGFLKK